MAGDLQRDGVKFCRAIFDTVRKMSADGLGVTRQGYSQTETDVINYLKSIGMELGLEIHTDPAGNVWMTYPGKNRELNSFVAGSHADSVPQGGNFDGLAGITAALAVAWWMRRNNYTPERDYVVLVMRCEESSFFGKAYVGSLAITGRLTDADMMLKHRTEDSTLGECVAACGFRAADMTSGQPLLDLSKIEGFVELHIEQGPTLDSSEIERVGIVTGIRGNVRHRSVKCIGQTAHSGAVDKEYRHDAVLAAADLLHRMDVHWDEWLAKGEDLVFTVGVVHTGRTAAISVIPGEVSFTVDMRSLNMDTIERFHELFLKEADAVARERGVKFEFDKKLVTLSSSVSDALSEKIEKAAQLSGLPVRRLASGAGHDTAVLSNAGVPSAMIFVANQNGSHNPYEDMKIEDFMKGAALLWHTIEHYEEL